MYSDCRSVPSKLMRTLRTVRTGSRQGRCSFRALYLATTGLGRDVCEFYFLNQTADFGEDG